MRGSHTAWLVVIVTIATLAVQHDAVSQNGWTSWQSRVTPQILSLWKASNALTPNATGGSELPLKSNDHVRYDARGRVQIDVSFDCAKSTPTTALQAAEMLIGTSLRIPPTCVVEGGHR